MPRFLDPPEDEWVDEDDDGGRGDWEYEQWKDRELEKMMDEYDDVMTEFEEKHK